MRSNANSDRATTERTHRRPGDVVAQWCRRFQHSCRDRGLRLTAQRLAVYRVLASDASHPSVDAVFEAVRREMPTVSFATVYRVLESLEMKGLVRRVSTTAGVARYDANVAPHHHFVCRRCGRMVDGDDGTIAHIPLPRIGPRGFTAEELDIRILGLCGTCQRRRQSGRRANNQQQN